MMQSRFVFVFLLLAYLSVTPAGVYTCACLVSAEPNAHEAMMHEHSEQGSMADTAVASLLSFFSLTFLTTGTLCFLARRKTVYRATLLWLEPSLFSEPPPTPPPHFS